MTQPILNVPPPLSMQVGSQPVQLNIPKSLNQEMGDDSPIIEEQNIEHPIDPSDMQFEDPGIVHIEEPTFNEPIMKNAHQENHQDVHDEFKNVVKQEVQNSSKEFINPNTRDSQHVKYQIFDLFWLLNPKIQNQKEIHPNEAHLVTISFNATFGNLRISMFEIPEGAIKKHVIFWNLLKKQIVGVVYPTSVFKLLKDIKSNNHFNITCLEQIITYTGADWQQNRPLCRFEKIAEGQTMLAIYENENSGYFYVFTDWQRDALIHACNFVLDKGFVLSGQSSIQK